MEEKFKSSNKIKLFAYFVLLIIVAVMMKLSIKDINDESLNLMKKVEEGIFYIAIVMPFVLIAVRVSKYYVFISEDYIEVQI